MALIKTNLLYYQLVDFDNPDPPIWFFEAAPQFASKRLPAQYPVFFSVIIQVSLDMQIFADTILNALAKIRTSLAKFCAVHLGDPLAGERLVCCPGVYRCFPAETAFSDCHRFHDITP